jgi:hypothetical protein
VLKDYDPEIVIAALREDVAALEIGLSKVILELLGPGPSSNAGASSTQIPEDLLEITGGPIELPSVEGVFVGRQTFKVDRNGKPPISYLGANFKANFLDVQEGDLRPIRVRQRKLLKASVDGLILSTLGGEARARMALGHVYEFMKTANRSLWYIFYVADKNGIVWAVDVIWHDSGWRVDADPVASPNEGRDGSRVVSPSP